jgi:hypothetical protein
MVRFPRIWPATVAGSLLIAALCGCTTGRVFPVLVEPAPSSTQRPAPDPSSISCDDLLSSAKTEAYAKAGFVEVDDFAARQAAENAPDAAFLDYGGALCQWGVPNTDTADVFGASAIDGEQKAIQRARLQSAGYSAREHNGGELYSLGHESAVDSFYLIVDGFWFFANSEAGVDHIRQNADVG